MKIFKRLLWVISGIGLIFALTFLFIQMYLPRAEYGFARPVSVAEAASRTEPVAKAISHLGSQEGTEGHWAIIDCYNTIDPLPQGYTVTYEDNWCAAFVSAVAVQCGLTDIIPVECSCQRQIGLWQDMGRWEESDTYLPLPGDIIYYDWDVRTLDDSTGWSDHVGIVVGTHGPFIKVIEGNKDDTVTYRYIIRWDPRIRGYGLPEYA